MYVFLTQVVKDFLNKSTDHKEKNMMRLTTLRFKTSMYQNQQREKRQAMDEM